MVASTGPAGLQTRWESQPPTLPWGPQGAQEGSRSLCIGEHGAWEGQWPLCTLAPGKLQEEGRRGWMFRSFETPL